MAKRPPSPALRNSIPTAGELRDRQRERRREAKLYHKALTEGLGSPERWAEQSKKMLVRWILSAAAIVRAEGNSTSQSTLEAKSRRAHLAMNAYTLACDARDLASKGEIDRALFQALLAGRAFGELGITEEDFLKDADLGRRVRSNGGRRKKGDVQQIVSAWRKHQKSHPNLSKDQIDAAVAKRFGLSAATVRRYRLLK